MNLLTVEIDGAVRKKSTVLAELPVFHGIDGLERGIDPSSNKSMLQAADDQQVYAIKYLHMKGSANLIHASESATLSTRALLHSQDAAGQKTLRQKLYAGDFRANDRNATGLS